MNILHTFAQTLGDYTTTTNTTTTSGDLTPAAALGIIFTIFFFVALLYVIVSLLIGQIFKKAGIATWIAWVPFYNQWKLLEIGGQQGFWAVLAIIPIVQYVSLVFMFIAMYNIGLKLGKSGAFVLWAIFFPYVWYIWLALDKSTWNESLGAPSLAIEHRGTPTGPVAPTV